MVNTPEHAVVNRFELASAMYHRDITPVYGRVNGIWKIYTGRINGIHLEDGSGRRLLVSMILTDNESVLVYVESV